MKTVCFAMLALVAAAIAVVLVLLAIKVLTDIL